MVLGLVAAVQDTPNRSPPWLNRLTVICVSLGLAGSIVHCGGLGYVSQWLELGLAAGFLIGTYQLARDQPTGFGWYVLMHLCCGALMWLQGHPWLFGQQLVSLIFIADAWWTSRHRRSSQESGA